MEFYCSISEPCLSFKPDHRIGLDDFIECESIREIGKRIEDMQLKISENTSFTSGCIDQLLGAIEHSNNHYDLPCVVVPQSMSTQSSEKFWTELEEFLGWRDDNFSDLSHMFNSSANSALSQINQWLKSKNFSDSCSLNRREAIFVRDLSCQNIKILEKLVKSLVNKNCLNFLLVVGVSSSLEIFEQLPSDVLNYLSIKPLEVPSNRKQLSNLFSKLFLDNDACEPYWKPGPKVSTFLNNRFLNSDLSIDNYVSSLKLCVIEDSLALEENEEVIEPRNKVSHQHKVIKFFIDLLLHLETREACSSWIKSVSSFCVYEDLVSGDFFRCESWKMFEDFMKYADDDEFSLCLDYCSVSLRDLGLTVERQKIDEIIKLNTGKNDKIENEQLEDVLTDCTNLFSSTKPGKIRQHNLRAALVSKKQEQDKLEAQMPRNRFSAFMEQTMSCMTNGLKNDIDRVFDNWHLLTDCHEKSHRLLVSKALQEPSLYLKCKCCDGASCAQPCLPDSSLVYYLYSEIGGMYQNLLDFLSTFLFVSESGKPKKKTKNTTIDEKAYVRFLQALSNMQFVGYLKVSKRRKTEHVVKLTWNAI